MPPAARVGDPVGHPGSPGALAPPGVPTVLIGGRPAANVSTQSACPVHPPAPAPIAPGCPTVLIGGLPAARLGDMAGCSAPIVTGCPTVLIGG